MRPHNLCKFFISVVRRCGIDEAEAMAGHQSGLVKIYANPLAREDGDKRLAEVYLKAEPELSIYKQTVEIKKFKEEVEEGDKKIQKLITGLSVENMELKEKMRGVSAEVETLNRRFDNLAKTINLSRDDFSEVLEMFGRFLREKDRIRDALAFQKDMEGGVRDAREMLNQNRS